MLVCDYTICGTAVQAHMPPMELKHGVCQANVLLWDRGICSTAVQWHGHARRC